VIHRVRILTAILLVSSLSACAPGSAPGVRANVSAALEKGKHSQTFEYVDGQQTFEVPSGVTKVIIEAWGAGGGPGGSGGFAKATIAVIPEEQLAVFVRQARRKRA
jgi:hypothetical protein